MEKFGVIKKLLEPKQRRLLLIALACFVAVVVIIIIIWLVVMHGSSSHHGVKPGNSSGWRDASAMLQGAMNTSANPCVDFYEFACGKWIVSHHPKPPKTREGQKTATLNRLITNLSAEFAKIEPENSSYPEVLRIGKEILTSCIANFNQTKFNWVDLIKNTTQLELDIGGWPMVEENWNSANFSLFSSIGLLSARGVDTFLSIKVDADWNSPEEHAVFIDAGKLGLRSPKYYINNLLEPNVVSYKSKILNIATIMRNESTNFTIQIQSDTESIVALETKLAYAMSLPSLEFTLQNNRYNISGLQKRWPSINWTEIFEPLLNEENMPKSFIVTSEGYIDQLVGIMRTTSSRTVANYLGWHYINTILTYKPKAFKKPTPAWLINFLDLGPQNEVTTCFLLLANDMTFVPGYVYSKIHPSPLESAHNLSQDIQTALKSILKSAKWLDNASLKNATLKLDQIMLNIGYPTWISNITYISSIYTNLMGILKAEGTENFYHVLQTLRKDKKMREFSKVQKPVDRSLFKKPPIDFFADYDNVRNSLTSPASIMDDPYFNPTFPKSMQYGTYGWLLARLMVNSLSTQGVQFLPDGNLGPLFNHDVMTNYHGKVRCYVQQYNQYCYPAPINLCIDGEATEEENVADNVALQVAYKAFDSFRQNSKQTEPPLPGLEKYSDDELFFLAYSNIWCRNETPTALRNWLLIDRYSPAKYRIQGSVRNFPEFGKSFKCKSGEPLYPNPSKTEICKLF